MVHEHMPELLQVLKHFCAASPISPRVWVVVQRCFGGPDHRRIYDPVLTGDAPRQAGDRRSTKIAWNVSGRQLKPTVPTQRESVPRRNLAQDLSGTCGGKGRVCDQKLDVLPQVDGPMHLRFDLGVEHAPGWQISRFFPGAPEFRERVQ